MKLVEGMSYRQWQKRNTEHFKYLNKIQQKEARKQGYCNLSWDKVQNSWRLICKVTKNIASFFEHKLSKGDLNGAIELSLLEAEKAKRLARRTIKSLNIKQRYFDKLADETLAKYPVL